MDQQNHNAPRPVPTEAEIARLEAEAVAAMRRGETPQAAPAPESPAPESPAQETPEQHDFVPYVDDVPASPAPRSAASAEAGADTPDEDDEPYIPGPWEKRIDALSPEQWKRWQIIGGAALGLVAVACLFVFGQELSTYGLIVSAIIAIFVPRYLERAWRHNLTTARIAMVIAMVIGLAAMALIIGMRQGFAPKVQ